MSVKGAGLKYLDSFVCFARETSLPSTFLTLTLRELSCFRGGRINGFLGVIRFKFSLALSLQTFK